MKEFDCVVIGAGPGGYTAALRLAELKKRVALIDKRNTLGGTCLNVGCIPSKALLESTKHVYFIKNHAKDFGVHATCSVDFPHMMQRKDRIISDLVKGLDALFEKKVERFAGEASFVTKNQVEVNGEVVQGKHFILATGSETISLPFLPIDEKKILSSTGALSLKEIPKTLLVIGAGVIGVELSSVFSRLGTKVTVLEMLDRVCPMLDPALSRTLQKVLEKQGITFQLNATIKNRDTYEKEGKTHTIHAEKILVAVGRRPYTENLGLEKIGVSCTKGFIDVDDCFRTTVPHIFAIGDVIAGPQLAHRASDEGFVVAEFLGGKSTPVNYLTIPNVIYTHPEVASVGISEGKSVTSFLKANGRALCEGETEGFVKLNFDPQTKRLLGMHIIAPNASEMIGEGVLALLNKITLEELAKASHAHPTLSEAIKEAALKQ